MIGEEDSIPTPKLVGYFSRDGRHEHCTDLSLLRYLTVDINKVTPIDLSTYSINHYQRDCEKFPFYRFILSHLDIIRNIGGNSIMDAPIITVGSHLLKLWDLFNNKNNMREYYFTIHLLKGKVYFLLENTFVPGEGSNGNIFVHAMQSNAPNCKPKPNTTADANEHFFGVFEMQLKSHTLIYQNVIDCILANTDDKKTPVCDDNEVRALEDLRTREFVKFKLIKLMKYKKNLPLYKTRELWMKSFLGNADICVGFSSNENIIDKIKMYNRQKLRSMNPWLKPSEFFEQLDIIFSGIKKILIYEEMTVNYLRSCNYLRCDNDIPKVSIRFASSRFGIFHKVNPNTEFDFPDWFRDEIEKKL